MTVKGGAKFKEKLTRSLKHDKKNLVNFHESRRKPKNLHFMGSFYPKHIKFLMKKDRRVCLMTLRVMQSLKRN